MRTALLLIAHGSREDQANSDLLHVAAELGRRSSFVHVQAAFLELAQPDLDTAAAHCAAQEAECIVLVPYFLSAGVHVQRDLTAARKRLSERYPRVEFRLADPLGRHPLLIDVVAERVRAVLSSD
jgi:sirohydrochlorin ferrochelatase